MTCIGFGARDVQLEKSKQKTVHRVFHAAVLSETAAQSIPAGITFKHSSSRPTELLIPISLAEKGRLRDITHASVLTATVVNIGACSERWCRALLGLFVPLSVSFGFSPSLHR